MTEPKLCLVMIVKNESRIIERCLRAAAPVLDAICICDTGSTDDTPKRIEAIGASLGLPTRVVDDAPFKDFGTNRTASFRHARDWVAAVLRWDLARSYALLADADMILKIGQSAQELIEGKPAQPKRFSKRLLKPEHVTHYLLDQVNGQLVYANTRLLRFDVQWECVGKTHEYWGGGGQASKMPMLCYDDRDDGGCKQDKLERDIRLLRATLEEKPNDGRTLFYLGRTLKDTGKHDEGIALLERRAKLDDFPEESFYALLEAAHAQKAKGDWPRAAETYMRAWQKRPHRPEPLLKLATYYREKSANQLALMFAREASKTPRDARGDVLFVDFTAHEYAIDYELSIAGFYVEGARDEAFEACDRMLHARAPDGILQSARSNIMFYLRALKERGATHVKLATPSVIPQAWRALNPALAPLGTDMLLCNIRCVNYHHEPRRGTYDILDASGKIRTRNVLRLLDAQLAQVGSDIEIVDKVGQDYQPSQVVGLEDARIFWLPDGRLAFTTATRIDRDLPQQVLCITECAREQAEAIAAQNGDGAPKSIAVTHKVVLRSEPQHKGECQKNWLYLGGDGSRVRFLYAHDPPSVLEFDLEGVLPGVNHRNPTKCALPASPWTGRYVSKHYRGSGLPARVPERALDAVRESVAQGMRKARLDDKAVARAKETQSLGVTHEVVFKPHRVYLHRVVAYDAQGCVLYASRPFQLSAETVEYSAGCGWLGADFCISYGYEDASAEILRLTPELLCEILKREEQPK